MCLHRAPPRPRTRRIFPDMSLDDIVARAFDDHEPTKVGSGWLSGTASVFLGTLALGAVACFYWPALLTSPDVRALLPMPAVRTLLQLVIGLGFLLGLLSALLRTRKVLGLTGIAMALAAGLAGGGNIPVEGAVPTVPVYLGLDWFLLNILLLAVLFVPSYFVVMQRFEEWRARKKGAPAAPEPEPHAAA